VASEPHHAAKKVLQIVAFISRGLAISYPLIVLKHLARLLPALIFFEYADYYSQDMQQDAEDFG
jgi:hypothetical protein